MELVMPRHPTTRIATVLICSSTLPLDGCASTPAPRLQRVGLFEDAFSLAVPASFVAGDGSSCFAPSLASSAVLEMMIDPTSSARIDVARVPSNGMSSPRTEPPEGHLLDLYMHQIFGSRTNLDWIDNDIIDIEGESVLFWDFKHGPEEQQIRTFMTMTTTPHDLFVVAFSFPAEFEECWTRVAGEIVGSLREADL